MLWYPKFPKKWIKKWLTKNIVFILDFYPLSDIDANFRHGESISVKEDLWFSSKMASHLKKWT